MLLNLNSRDWPDPVSSAIQAPVSDLPKDRSLNGKKRPVSEPNEQRSSSQKTTSSAQALHATQWLSPLEDLGANFPTPQQHLAMDVSFPLNQGMSIKTVLKCEKQGQSLT